MRITDIIVEQDIISQIKKDYQRGYDAVDNIVNPAKWGSSDKKQPAQAKELDSLTVKQTLKIVVDGRRVYDQERQTLTQLANQVRSGAIETKQNAEQVSAILKLAAAGKPLNDQQRAVISAFAQER